MFPILFSQLPEPLGSLASAGDPTLQTRQKEDSCIANSTCLSSASHCLFHNDAIGTQEVIPLEFDTSPRDCLTSSSLKLGDRSTVSPSCQSVGSQKYTTDDVSQPRRSKPPHHSGHSIPRATGYQPSGNLSRQLTFLLERPVGIDTKPWLEAHKRGTHPSSLLGNFNRREYDSRDIATPSTVAGL